MRAHADVVVPRAELRVPGRKAKLRVQLFDALSELGHVDHIERYVQDPPDGPYRDGTFEELDLSEVAIVRIVGQVTPIKRVN